MITKEYKEGNKTIVKMIREKGDPYICDLCGFTIAGKDGIARRKCRTYAMEVDPERGSLLCAKCYNNHRGLAKQFGVDINNMLEHCEVGFNMDESVCCGIRGARDDHMPEITDDMVKRAMDNMEPGKEFWDINIIGNKAKHRAAGEE